MECAVSYIHGLINMHIELIYMQIYSVMILYITCRLILFLAARPFRLHVLDRANFSESNVRPSLLPSLILWER
jgi:hypothetical protein